MAARKRKKTRKRARRAPVIVVNPTRRKKRKARRRRRRNPAAATMVPYMARPPMVVNPSRRKRRRKRRRNPKLLTAVKQTFTSKNIIPIVVGGGLGVVGIAVANKYIAPRVANPKWQALIEGGIALAGMPLVNNLYKGAGPYFTGFMAGHALSKVITPLLPFGDMDEMDAISELGAVEFVGDLDGLDGDDADAAVAGDGGLEDLAAGDDGQVVLVDGLGAFPPAPIPRLPPPLLMKLKRANLLWLLRLGIPHAELIRLLRLAPPAKRAALMRLQTLYKRKRLGRGRPHAGHPLVAQHPTRRPRGPRGRGPMRGRHPKLRAALRRKGVRPPGRGRRRGFRGFDDVDDDDASLMGVW